MRLSHVLCALVGGAAVALLGSANANRLHPAAPPRAAVAPRQTLDPRVDVLLARLDRIEELLAQRVAPPVVAGTAQADSPETTPPDDAEPGRIESLRLRARGLSTDPTRAADAVAAWDAVAAAAGDPEARAEAWFEQGEVYREVEDFPHAADAWQKVVDAVGLQSLRGQSAAYQLAWARAYSNESAAAYETFRTLAATPGLPKPLEAATRLQVAAFARANGDLDTARREYERCVADYAGDAEEHYRRLAQIASEQLHELE